ncbi:MAG: hypothetical protein HXS47_06310 [Theionarchaea archaeon]|nr:hypothetical protein [Theionarchaea archaeon]
MTAKKLYIRHIVEGVYDRSQLDTIFGKVSEVRIVGTLVDTFLTDDQSYTSLTVDDGTETIRVKGWRQDVERLAQFHPGDLVDIVGKVREYNDEIYLSPQIISKITPNKWILRELDLMKVYIQSDVAVPLTPSQGQSPELVQQPPSPQPQRVSEQEKSAPKSRNQPEHRMSAQKAVGEQAESSSHAPLESDKSKVSFEEKESIEEIEEFNILEGDEVVETVLGLLKEEMTKDDLITQSGLDEIDVELALRELLDEGLLIKEGERYKKKSP